MGVLDVEGSEQSLVITNSIRKDANNGWSKGSCEG